MCVVSMIMDHYTDKWRQPIEPLPHLPTSPVLPALTITTEEILEFKRLLERAREYDKRNNEPNCELEEKKQALKKIADAMDIKIDFL